MGIVAEEWRDVVGYEGTYQISDRGAVRSVDRTWVHPNGSVHICRGQAKRCRNNERGYEKVRLKKFGERPRWFMVHRVVGAAFIGPCPKGLQVNHIDGNKQNNFKENLEYVTPKENREHAVRIGLMDGNRGGAKIPSRLTAETVIQIRNLHASGVSYCQLARDFGVVHDTIRSAVLRKTWAHV